MSNKAYTSESKYLVTFLMQLAVPSAGNKGNPYNRQYNEISAINYNQRYTSILPNDTYHHINLFISTRSNLIKPWKGMHDDTMLWQYI
jgi:hypothetical protein